MELERFALEVDIFLWAIGKTKRQPKKPLMTKVIFIQGIKDILIKMEIL